MKGAAVKLAPGFSRSLAARLIIAAAAWSILVLAVVWLLLAQQYRQSVVRGLDADLRIDLDVVISAAEYDAEGALTLSAAPNDPRFDAAQSGRYWAVARANAQSAQPELLLRSNSLWDESLSWPDDGAARILETPGQTLYYDVVSGPYREPARIAATSVTLPGAGAPLVFLAAADPRPVLADANRFNTTLLTGLSVLALGLLAMLVIQVVVGLSPLQRLRRDVADVRRGKAKRLDGAYPTEVEPLTHELNALLDHNREVVERARTHVGNLAHALKTPISVLVNEARVSNGPFAELVARQTAAMSRNVDHYLQRAQAAARAETIGSRTDVAPVAQDIARTLERLYGRSADISINAAVAPEAVFRGERQDLEEMIGNLTENACKYGGGEVRLRAHLMEDGWIEIVVEDDGPGLTPEMRETALQRGQRLDETAPGSGLGLSIVADLARLYGGELRLDDSELGGLKAALRLPRAD
jgi:signal transduction histidine kinase